MATGTQRSDAERYWPVLGQAYDRGMTESWHIGQACPKTKERASRMERRVKEKRERDYFSSH
jgi:hypothetical protein